MESSDAAVFSAKLVELSEVLDGKLSEARFLLYFDALRDLPLDSVRGALREAAKTCRFFPKPVELRELAVGGNDDDQAEIAWLEWKTAARQIGAYAPFHTDDGALADTLIAVFGSWPAACTLELSPEMWAAKRKEFGRVYSVMRRRGLSAPRQLAGQCEIDNQRRFGAIDAAGMISQRES